MRRILAITALVAALALAACGSEDETSTPAQGKAQPPTATGTTTVAPPATGTTPTAPKSATIPSNGAPDSGISTRPGGPGSDSGY